MKKLWFTLCMMFVIFTSHAQVSQRQSQQPLKAVESSFRLDSCLLRSCYGSGVSHTRVKAPTLDGGQLYFTQAVSAFDSYGYYSSESGNKRNFGASVKIEGDKAYISNIGDLYYGDILKEYVIEGNFDRENNIITIPTISLGYGEDIAKATRVADISYNYMTNALLLYAGELNEWGEPIAETELVFDVSEDLSVIIPRTPFGIMAYSLDYNMMNGCYDYYVEYSMTLPSEKVCISALQELIDFSEQYVISGKPGITNLTLLNSGSEETVVSVTCQGNGLSAGMSSITIPPCSTKEIQIYIMTQVEGSLSGLVTIDGEDMNTSIVIPVETIVHPVPDYSVLLTPQSESMTFSYFDEWPFAIIDTDYGVLAKSTNSLTGTEAWFEGIVNIPTGKVGVLKFTGINATKMPNEFLVEVDNNPVYSSSSYTDSTDPYQMKGIATIGDGYHRIRFVHNVNVPLKLKDGSNSYSSVSSIEVSLIDSTGLGGFIGEEVIEFPVAYFDTATGTRESLLTLYNYGTEPIEIIGYDGTNGFMASEEKYWGDTTVWPNSKIELPVIWTISALGEVAGTAIVQTSAGDFSVPCHGTALPVPTDLRKIITDTNFSLDTDSEYPFIYSEADNALINSSSFSDNDGTSYSWIEATFMVPEGKLGLLDWIAMNDSPEPYVFMGTPYLNTGVIITLDGEKQLELGGYDKCMDAHAIYTPGDLIFKPGEHRVKFNYKKNGSFGVENGKACFWLKALNLDIVDNTEFKGYITSESVNFKGLQHTVGRVGHQTVGIVNLSDEEFYLDSWEVDGPFDVRDLTDYSYENTFPIMIEYYPTRTGIETGSITLHTNVGDFTVECEGNGIDLERDHAIFYEGFEYDYQDEWESIDRGIDGNGWLPFQLFIDTYEPNYPILYGYQAVGSVCYDYNVYNWFSQTVDHILISPEIKLPADGQSSVFFIAMAKAYGENNLELLVGKAADDIDTYTTVKTWDIQATDVWYEYAADLSDFNGQNIQLAFRHKVEPNQFSNYFIMIDDVLVTSSSVTGITDSIDDKGEEYTIEYYDMTGRRVNNPTSGIYVELRRNKDGSTKATKRYIKS
ncbi:MAG: hypothetical protein HDR88_12935 [Bacteroides sp.]|nr:hypothetical protein [Bacteroides sp.]